MSDRRRRALARTVLCLLAVGSMAACTPPGLPPPIAPAASSVAGSVPAAVPQVTIGVDGTVAGFNPHAIADYSLADNAVADLVLPSISSVAADGTVQLNADVVETAKVTSTDPFTVTYTLDRNAAWSDGTPITAEDFSYLRDQMLVQPGTVDPAGYQLISGIVSRDAGKTVEVSFSRAVPDWMTLFSPLLPSHILKDSPGGWAEGLATGIPVSGNRFKMQSYDTVTGEITLVRNDKYWGPQPVPSIAVLRIGTASALTAALSRGDLQAVLLQPDALDERALEAAVPADRRVTVPLPGTVQLIMNNTDGATANVDVRKAISQALDLDQIRTVLAGGSAYGGGAAASLITLPKPGGAGDAGSSDPARALSLLEGAGYHRDSVYFSKDGQILRLTLTYPSTDGRMAAAAALVQAQLGAVGIEVDLIRDAPRALVDQRLALGHVDLGLIFVPRGPSDGLSAASSFGCPLPVASNVPTSPATPARAGNLSGLCSSQIQDLLDDATSGPVPDSLAEAVSSADPVIAITRPSAVLATSAAVAPFLHRQVRSLVFSGALSGLAQWPSR